ncbi:hypothetical protein [Ochrobactrum sp. EDr1-4]|uniref:hypothetical protein n=1 Tax=Ochrobactrum sp. EDr1-4 TaxID=3368622 RepID=UPI003BA15975
MKNRCKENPCCGEPHSCTLTTRPAAPVEGLETVEHQYWTPKSEWKKGDKKFVLSAARSGETIRELVAKSQAEDIIAAERGAQQRLLDIIEEANAEIESLEVEKVRLENRLLVLETDNAALTARVKELGEALEEIDRTAQAGLCAGTFQGARAFHEDIRTKCAALEDRP